MGADEAAAKDEDLAALLGRSNTQAMTHELTLCDLNLEDQIIVEVYRDCDEDGCTVRVHNWNLFIGGHVVQLPKELREKIYPMLDDYAADLDPFDS
jgi:hypothetical protein